MTDDWDFYFCRVDGNSASVFVDLGARSRAPVKGFPNVASMRLHMNQPRQDGLSSQEEFETLTRIEDSLAKAITSKAIYVGRVTSNGYREFFCYSSLEKEWEHAVSSVMMGFSQYRYDISFRVDSSWKTYFGYLLPSPMDNRRIQNRRLLQALESKGDTLQVSREIDHWAYFSDSQCRQSFIEQVSKLGYMTRALSDAKEPLRFGVQIWRMDTPAYERIDDITIPLFESAQKLGGEYDGWECMVVADKNSE